MRVFIVGKYDDRQDRYFPIKVFPSTDQDEDFFEKLDKNVSKFFEDIYSNPDYTNISIKRCIGFREERFALYNVFYNIGEKRYGKAYEVFEREDVDGDMC